MTNHVRKLAVVFAIACLLTPAAAQRTPASAVVTIIVKTPAGTAFGSGVFVSADGIVLTCYHVVQDATSIEILNTGTLIPNDSIVVEKIDPVHDLATLKVANFSPSIGFYALGAELPTPADELFVVGYIGGLQNQTVAVRTTQSGYAKASRFLDGRTSLFAQRDVDLIPLNALIYRGMSGAPLIFRGKTIGIVSGSLAEGGTLAWAIPAPYINSASATPVQRRAGMVKWPALSLMATGWSSLRRQLSAESPYAEDVASLATFSRDASQRVRALYSGVRPAVSAAFATVRQALSRLSARDDDSYFAELIEGKNGPATEAMRALKALADKMEDFYDLASDLGKDMDKWRESLKRLERGLAIAEENGSTRRALRRVREINRELRALEDAPDTECDVVSDALESLLDGDRISPTATVAEFRAATQQKCITIFDNNFQTVSRAIESMSTVGQALENVLEEPALKELERPRR